MKHYEIFDFLVWALLIFACTLSIKDSLADEMFEHGTLTPTIEFATTGDLSVSYGIRTVSWYRVGDIVYFAGRIVFTPTFTTGSGAIVLNAFPLPVSTLQSGYHFNVLPVTSTITFFTGRTALVGRLDSSDSKARIAQYGSGLGSMLTAASNITSGVQQDIRFTGFYPTPYTFDGNIYDTYDALGENDVDEMVTAINQADVISIMGYMFIGLCLGVIAGKLR